METGQAKVMLILPQPRKWHVNGAQDEELQKLHKNNMPAEYKTKILGFRNLWLLQGRNHILNLGQIAIWIVSLTSDSPLNRTVDTKGAELMATKTSGCKKTHYAAILICCAEGTKLFLLLIFKQKWCPKIKFCEEFLSIFILKDEWWTDKK